MARSSISAGTGVANVGNRSFTQGVFKTHRASASEGRRLVGKLSYNACSSILTFLFSSVTRVSVLAVFSNIVRGALAICFASLVDFTSRSMFAGIG